jgi:hypothetical protein
VGAVDVFGSIAEEGATGTVGRSFRKKGWPVPASSLCQPLKFGVILFLPPSIAVNGIIHVELLT